MIFRDIYGILPADFRKRGILVALSIFLRAILDFAGIAVLIPVLAGLLEEGNTPMSVLPVAFGALGFIIIKSILVALLAKYRSRYVFSLYSVLSEKVLRTYLGKGLLFIRQSDSVELANRTNAVTMVFISGVIMSILNVLSSAVLLVIILTALFIYDPAATLTIMVVIVPLMFGYSYVIRSKMRNLGTEENKARRRQMRSVLDFFRGYADYAVNDAFRHQMDRFEDAVGSIGNVRRKSESWSAVSSGFMEIAVILSIIIIMMLSFSSSWEISMTFGVFALSALKVLPSIRSIVAGWQAFQTSSYSVHVLKEVLQDEPEASVRFESIAGCTGVREAAGDVPGAGQVTFSEEIELRDVCFGYPGASGHVFDGLDLKIRKGEYVGIKGSSGLGKTTLFNIMMGFYFPERGGLYVDGVKITEKNARAWQSMIGYVPQDIFLVNGTFVENVAFGIAPECADRDRIREILTRVGLWDWISSLPEGIDSMIAEAGNTVSGGQKQRIGIARALYKGASVLFFDEATSSVDAEAESEINAFIGEMSEMDGNLTVIVIAHRQETLDSCGRVIELEKLM